ncbi:hypothetical protein BHE97_11530 [Aeromicrobium sp. PE09-221]|uniref:FtsX-like permease family protein n=1 Tax=Aeromicrobium sp. PE09-221 TaxID=1898043 RepID=UPI000B3EC517|nr:ABC transporter permease [Aeromicrobium sp. PE09-221]OUZ09124.1 hypothetical protein BHE97_11530 [Aeromicrobium sp. PE09-221]
MNGAASYARSSASANRGSLIGAFVTILLAALLLALTGTWIDAGVRLSGEQGSGELLALASSFAGTTIVVVIFIVMSVLTQALRPRSRQLALLRTIGATPSQVRWLVTGETLVVFLMAAPVGAVAGGLAARAVSGALAASGVVPEGFVPAFSPLAILGTLLVLTPAVMLATRLSVRSVTRAGSVEARTRRATDDVQIARPRAITAVVFALLGLASATVPFGLGGVAGLSAAAMSGILLVIAAAVAGPVIVQRGARLAGRLALDRGSVGADLALRFARGSSRRLTAAITPLALLFAIALVQTGSNHITFQGARHHLDAALRVDLVAETSDAGVAARIREIPGVEAVGSSTGVPASVWSDSEEPTGVGLLDALSWEHTTLTVFPGEEFLAPDLTHGSWEELHGADTIAMSSDAAMMSFSSIGDSVDLDVGEDGRPARATIVAIYDGGLAFGDYLVGPHFTGVAESGDSTIFVNVRDGEESAVGSELADLGLRLMTGEGYAQATMEDAQGEQRLSTGATLVLLVFVGVAAANTLMMMTAARRGEFELLRRTGATTRQLLSTVLAESLFVGLAAIGIGAASVLPALLGMSWAILGTFTLGAGIVPVAILAGVVMGIAVLSMVSAAVVAGRSRRIPLVLAS